jgi:hypothetical protein
MPLKGYLSVINTTQILNIINLAKKTGVLRIFEGLPTSEMLILGDGQTKIPKLEPGKQRAEVFFKQGQLLYARLSDKSGDLTSVLQKAGKLNDEQARSIRERAKNYSDKALALLLINANYVSKQHILQSMQKHTVDILFDLMSWTKEPFEFVENVDAPADHILVPTNLENVIIEGTRMITDHNIIMRELPNLDFALVFRDDPGKKLTGVQLSPAEWRVVGFVSPKNTIRQIAKACNMTDIEIRRVVHALREAGIVELVKPPAAATAGVGGKGAPKTGGRLGELRKENNAPNRAMVDRLIARIKEI